MYITTMKISLNDWGLSLILKASISKLCFYGILMFYELEGECFPIKTEQKLLFLNQQKRKN